MDLAKGHVAALAWLTAKAAAAHGDAPGAPSPTSGAAAAEVFNLGTGSPSSVMEVVAAYEAASGRTVAYSMGPRRPGDVAGSWAVADKAAAELGWRATLTLPDMCADSWRWASANPFGFAPHHAAPAAADA